MEDDLGNKFYPKTKAERVLFDDGETFQQKLDNGELKGDQGPAGAKGDTGATGPKGADGLTTSISVNGQTYEQADGCIELPVSNDINNNSDNNLATTSMVANVRSIFNDNSFVHGRVVVALIELSNTTSSSTHQHAIGNFTIYRDNDINNPFVFQIYLGDNHFSTTPVGTIFGSTSVINNNYESVYDACINKKIGARLCKFKYNSKWYAGIEYSRAWIGNLLNVFTGYIKRKTFNPFSITYYSYETNSIENQEIYDSLNFDINTNNFFTFNGDVIYALC